MPDGNPAAIETPADLAKDGVRVVAALPEVPITKYTTEVLANLAELEGYPDGFAEAVTANTVSEEENVRAVLAKIELGEGDAALVYVTDALSSEGVDTVAIPDEANVLVDLCRGDRRRFVPAGPRRGLPGVPRRAGGPGRARVRWLRPGEPGRRASLRLPDAPTRRGSVHDGSL